MRTSETLQTNSLSNAPIGVPKRQKMSGKRIALICLGSVLAFIVIIILVANMATSAPLKVSDELISNIQKNKPSAAYNLLSDDAKATITEAAFGVEVNRISGVLTGKPNVIDKEISKSTDLGETAKITYEIKGNDNNTYTITVNLAKPDDKWLVLNFESVKK